MKLKLMLVLVLTFVFTNIRAQISIYDIKSSTDIYSFNSTQTPSSLVSAFSPSGTVTYQWEQSTTPVTGFSNISGGTSSTYLFSGPIAQTGYFRRRATVGSSIFYSNTIKIALVSTNWEDYTYAREHEVLISGQTTWNQVDQLAIGQKLQATTYIDGLGRVTEKVSREIATPTVAGGTWGDFVEYSQYDQSGRQSIYNMPYTTTNQSGKFKTTFATDQPNYILATYGETSPYSSLTFDGSPLNRTIKIKKPGTMWAASTGNSIEYSLNTLEDNVIMFMVDIDSDIPRKIGVYPANRLYKNIYSDENSKLVIEYFTKAGELILKKVQLNDVLPSDPYNGWICNYYIYNDAGLIRFEIQPEGVNWLYENGWTFTTLAAQPILKEQVFRYDYDKRRNLNSKKVPGIAAEKMVYDFRDRLVFSQTANQRVKPTPEWTTILYDDQDRRVLTGLYKTTLTQQDLEATITGSGAVAYSLSINGQSTSFVLDESPLTNSQLNDGSAFTPLKLQFYDDYSYAGAKTFSASFDNLIAYPTGGEPISKSLRTLQKETGTATAILGQSTFLINTSFFDDLGRIIQRNVDNIKTGFDISTFQYGFDDRLMSVNVKHTTSGSTGYSNYSVLTRNSFDNIGRIITVEKKFGANAFKAVASYGYDDIGRLKKKRLAPGYTGTGKTEIETLNYSYNIQNNITGINKDYALKTSGYNKWDNFFGLYIGYNNADGSFATSKLNGQMTGLIWNTQGDDAQRKYNFTYDLGNRFTSAAFTQRQLVTGAWSSTDLDFSVGGNSGKVSYDLNGNLLNMLHKGVIPGNATPIQIDNLSYSYKTLSNRLLKVTDNGTAGAANGKFNDFKDNSNIGDDYAYDDNGNAIVDLNKNVTNVSGGVSTSLGNSGIKYNHLDKPEEIRINGQGTISISYDADGNKLKKIYTPDATGVPVVTYFTNDFVYQGDKLQYINFEEGRVRVVQAVNQTNGFDILTLDGNIDLPNSTRGTFDYFIRDYLDNVRMVLTEATHMGSNVCTMELTRAANEEPIFGQTGSGNEVAATRTAKPLGWGSNTRNYASKLGSTAIKKMGPNVLLKVMAGDLVTATTNYYYLNTVTNTSGPNSLLSSLIASLTQAISASTVSADLVKSNATNITTQLNGYNPFIDKTSPDAANASGNTPKAYITVLFFDERFNFITEGSTALRVGVNGDNNINLTIPDTKAPKNGYAYAYISNESGEPVYFNNFQVKHTRGRITEEDHYYAYGLKISGISSQKLPDISEGFVNNKNLYNDKELLDESNFNWYEYGFRNYDPQIGRFPQSDPLSADYPTLTNYQFSGNDPINNIDIDGLEAGISTVGGVWNGSFLQAVNQSSSLMTVGNAVNAAVKTASAAVDTRLMLINARGMSDAIANANTIGLYDAFGNNHLDEYTDKYEKQAYLNGRVGGDLLAIAQGGMQINAGGGLAATTGLFTAGTGAIAGGAVALHGASTAATATGDMTWSLRKLYELSYTTGAALSIASSIIKAVPKDVPANGGEAKKHGSDPHNDAIGNKVSELRGDKNVRNIRKNQRQVDVNGKNVGRNQPDVQYDRLDPQTGKWKHYNEEFDNVPRNSVNHGKVIKARDPNSAVILHVIK